MHAARSETLAFLAPGLLHQLGNVLFTIQGNAHAASFATSDDNRERLAIAAAAERGAEALRVLRWLLGDPSATPSAAAGLLQQLADLARVPLREARQTIELRPTAGMAPMLVDPGDFCTVVLEVVRLFVALLPTGGAGSIVLELSGHVERRAVVKVGFQPTAGTLPFPLPLAELVDRLAAERLQLRAKPEVRAHGNGIELEFAATAGRPNSPPT